MKSYMYGKRSFFIQVTFTGIFCIIICFTCVLLAFVGYMPQMMLFFTLVAAYNVWNTFISKSTSEEVIIDDEYISFSAYNHCDKYLFSDIKKLRIREFPSSGKMYIRVNESSVLKGRYWIQTKQFENGKELFRALLDLEYKMHPDTLKARARTVNTEYLEAEKHIQPKRKKKLISFKKKDAKKKEDHDVIRK